MHAIVRLCLLYPLWKLWACKHKRNGNTRISTISRRIGMVLHLTVADPKIKPQVLMPALTDSVADTTEQTITHVATKRRFHAYPVPMEGVVVPFARRQIAVRFVGMAEESRRLRLKRSTGWAPGHSLDCQLHHGIATAIEGLMSEE